MTGVDIGTAVLQIQPSTRGLFKDLDRDLKGKGRDAGRAYTTEFDKETSKAKGIEDVANKALLFSGAVATGFFGLASAAGDLEAAVAANIQVLGDASEAVQDFAESGVEKVGLSETAILNAATSFGQLGKIIGLSGEDLATFSTDFVTLAADMAAFKNVSPQQALEDLQSAFAGQTEVVRKYGIFLDEATLKEVLFAETGERVTGVLTPQQRVLATSIALFQQTADIQGQAAREADGFERSVADLKATVGNIAADFGEPIVGFASGLLSAIGGGLQTVADWNEETGGMLATGLAAGLGIAAAASAAAGIAGKVKGAVDRFKDLNRAMQIGTGVVAGLALAVAAGFAIYGFMTRESRKLRERTNEVADALDEATTEALDYAAGIEAAGGEVDGFEVAQRAMSDALVGTGEDGEALTEALGALGVQTEDVTEIFLGLGEDPVAMLTQLAEEADVGRMNIDGLEGAVARLVASDVTGTGFDEFHQFLEDAGLGEQAIDALTEALWPTIAAMDEVNDQAGEVDLNAVAEQFLNHAVAADEDAEALVAQAERQAEASRNGEDALAVYMQLIANLEGMTDAEEAAAREALGLESDVEGAAAAAEEMSAVSADTIDTMSDLASGFQDVADRADAFTDALNRVIDPQLNLQESEDALIEATNELAAQVAGATAGEEGFALTLEGSSQAALDNREAIRGVVQSTKDHISAMVEEGASIDEVNAVYAEQRAALKAVLMQFGLTDAQAEEYLNTLGMTPDAVETTVELVNDEQARADLEAYIGEIGGIPTQWVTVIEAHIDQGQYQYAQSLLRNLTATRTMLVQPIIGPTSGRVQAVANAFGGYYEASKPTLAMIGEAPWDEAVLTVGNPTNLAHQLTDPNILNPILDALPKVEARGMGGGGPLVGELNVGSRDDIPAAMLALDELRWKMAVGA